MNDSKLNCKNTFNFVRIIIVISQIGKIGQIDLLKLQKISFQDKPGPVSPPNHRWQPNIVLIFNQQ